MSEETLPPLIAYIDENWKSGWQFVDKEDLEEWLEKHQHYHQREICKVIERK